MVASHKLFRFTLLSLIGGVLFTIVGGLALEWFIAIAREWGFFHRPTERAEEAVSLVWSFVTQTWVLGFLAFLAGLTGGAWIDYFLRLRDAGVPMGKAACLQKITNLYREAVGARLRVRSADANDFSYRAEFERLVQWKLRLLPLARRINVAKSIHLEALGDFRPQHTVQYNPDAPYSADFTGQTHLDAIWGEYIDRVTQFVDSIQT